VTLLTHHFFQSCPWDFILSFNHVRPTAGLPIPVCLHFHQIQCSFAPNVTQFYFPTRFYTQFRAFVIFHHQTGAGDLICWISSFLTLQIGSLGDARSAKALLKRSKPFRFMYRTWYWRCWHIFVLHPSFSLVSSPVFAPATSSTSGFVQVEDKQQRW
jgi:hypothetical protein